MYIIVVHYVYNIILLLLQIKTKNVSWVAGILLVLMLALLRTLLPSPIISLLPSPIISRLFK